jgi:Domain of unknown function (DUF4136)
MKALHRLPTSFALIKLLNGFLQRFRAPAQQSIARVAIKTVAYWLLPMAAMVQLTGCASVRLIDNEVSAFSALASVPAGSTYRFERLPSQQTNPQRQDQLEAIAQASMAKVGLVRVGDAPGSPAARYSVQMGINVQSVDAGLWGDGGPRFGGFVGIGGGIGRRGYGHLGYAFPYIPPPSYVRDVSLVLRDTANNQVVFETRAKHEGPWADNLAVLPAMFDAALQGFPTPAAGLRRVNIEIPR